MDIPEYRLDGKVALITGAGRGIGKGIAEVLAQAGADVIINSLTATHVTPLAAELARSTGRKVVPLVADVTRAPDVERAMAQVLRDFGKLDILVNNLGDSIRGPLVSLSDDDLRFVMDVNLTTTILCTRAAGPHMLARGSGKVINVASFASQRGGAGLSIYTTAKTALVGFTRAMGLEWAPQGVQVNAVAPGFFPDAVTTGEAGYAERVQSAKTTVPLGRVGRLREVGLLCLYLATPASDYMTGQTLYLDGGVTL